MRGEYSARLTCSGASRKSRSMASAAFFFTVLGDSLWCKRCWGGEGRKGREGVERERERRECDEKDDG